MGQQAAGTYIGSIRSLTRVCVARGMRACREEIPGLDDDRYGAADDEDPET